MCNILFDNIIFSLQKSGGASVVWQEHIQRIINEDGFVCRFIEYDNANTNMFRKLLNLPKDSITKLSSNFLSVKRYLNLNTPNDEPFLFHSSHYRLNNNKLCKNITTVHDFTYERYVNGIRRMVHSEQKWNSIIKADAVICVSESTKRDLLHYIPSVDESKIRVVHNGVSPEFCILSKQEYNLRLPFEDYGYILYVGSRHVPYKNFKTAVQVCNTLKLPLITVGGEPLSKEEKEWLDVKLGNANYANYWKTPTTELNELYNRALALVYPSVYEGFGIPIVEAQRASCPAIAFSSSSIPEVIGRTDTLIDEISTNSMIEVVRRLLSEGGFRDKVINEGIINSNRFSWDNTYNGTLNVYKELLR